MNDITTRARALLAAATPGPWEADAWYNCDDGGWAAIGPHHMATEDEGYDDVPESPAHRRAMADAALIAGVVNALPELLDEVERLRARIDAVGQILAESGCECPEGKHGDDSDDIATRGRTFIERLEAGQIPLRDGTDVTKALATAASLLRSCCGALASAERRAEDAGAQAAAWRQHVALRMKLSETTAPHGITGARERLMERELLAIWATVRSGNPAPLTEFEVLHAVEDVRRERDALRDEVERLRARKAEMCGCVHATGMIGESFVDVDDDCPNCGGTGGIIEENER